jgi:hypothetical protein
MSHRQALADQEYVDSVADTHDPDSTFVAVARHPHEVSKIRVWYLKNARGDLAWVRSSSEGTGYAQFRRRD